MIANNDLKKRLRPLLFVFYPLVNLLTALLLMQLTRAVFLCENSGVFSLTWQSLALIERGGLLFDISAVLYLNSLWLVLVCLPFNLKEHPWFRRLEKWAFIIPNAVGWLANFADSVFYAYRQHRTTMAVFSEFGGENNLARIIAPELLGHWYLILIFALLIAAAWKLYLPAPGPAGNRGGYYASRTLALGLYAGLFAFGVRGCTFSKTTRPISVGYAQRFATNPNDVDLVLNTPFALLRTIGGSPSPSPAFFSADELAAIYSPMHPPTDSAAAPLRGRNVMFIVLESFSAEFSGLMNPQLDGGSYKGYLPNLDSLLAKSLRFEHTYSNSQFSIDALPALLASTPRMRRPFVVSPYSLNHISGIGELLGNIGYASAFFHGADNESLGLQAFVRQAGFKNYFGLDEYLADRSTRGMADFDGTWGIWDGPFLQYTARKLSEMPQPFVAGVFTLSSHHPFDVPAELNNVFPPEGPLDIVRTLRYADSALGDFFRTASAMPWFANTVFVISADHTFLNEPIHPVYNNAVGRAKIPLAIYDPSGAITPGVHGGSMQQIDIIPTLLPLMGYPRPFFAYGKNALQPDGPDWSLCWTHSPQLMSDNYVLNLDPETWEPTALYDFEKDPELRDNLMLNILPSPVTSDMTRMLRAIIQTYSQTQQADSVRI